MRFHHTPYTIVNSLTPYVYIAQAQDPSTKNRLNIVK